MNINTLAPVKMGPEFGFRPDTDVKSWVINFFLNDEGMGGLLNYTGVTTWLAKNCPHIKGKIFVTQTLVPIMRDIHQSFVDWDVYASEQANVFLEDRTNVIGPCLAMDGKPLPRQFLTSLGCHPFDVGFAYYAHTCPAPPDAFLPVLDYPVSRLQPKIKKLSGKYVVIACGGTTETRTVAGKYFNPILDHIKSLGLTPVFLGNKRPFIHEDATIFPEDINYDAGIDLRNQTSLKEAAVIMQHAACTVGLDGGLLHLAALMKDSRIVFGYNITTVEHREPRRQHGKTVNIALTDKELQCAGCQSKWKNMAVHQFNKCFYGDLKCLDLLFENQSKRWKDAIDEVLK